MNNIVLFNYGKVYGKVQNQRLNKRETMKKGKSIFDSIKSSFGEGFGEWKPVGTKGQHTRAFPEKMVEDFLKVFPKAKIILDPFMG